MKALIKIAPIVVIIACVASLCFALKLSGVKTQLRQEKARLTDDLDKSRTETKQVRGDLKERSDQLNRSKMETADAKASFETAKRDLDAKSKQLEDFTARVTTAEQQATEAKAKLATAEGKVKELSAKLDTPEIVAAEQTAKDLESMKSENKVLGERVAVMTAENTKLKNDLEEEQRTPRGVRGKVVVAKPDWNFVVLNVGNAEHVRADTNFLVYRDSKLIAKARVTLVRPTTCVAELVAGFSKGTPQVGDSALLQQQGKM